MRETCSGRLTLLWPETAEAFRRYLETVGRKAIVGRVTDLFASRRGTEPDEPA